MTVRKEDECNCGVPNRCTRTVQGWLIALDNIPTATLFILGALILLMLPFGWFVNLLLSVSYLAYCGLSIVLFWALICPYCHHFDTKACPCGYGKVAPRFFKFKPGFDFRAKFRKNIAIMFPVWLAPFLGGICILWTGYGIAPLVLFTAFCVDGFVIIPSISKFVGCKDCEIKDQCPWMT